MSEPKLAYCNKCEDLVTYDTSEETISETFRGVEISYRFAVGRCKNCGTEVATGIGYNFRKSEEKNKAYGEKISGTGKENQFCFLLPACIFRCIMVIDLEYIQIGTIRQKGGKIMEEFKKLGERIRKSGLRKTGKFKMLIESLQFSETLEIYDTLVIILLQNEIDCMCLIEAAADFKNGDLKEEDFKKLMCVALVQLLK